MSAFQFLTRSGGIFIIVLCWSVLLFGQNESPYDCIYNHLYYLGTESYNPTLSARSFTVKDSAEGKELAIKLKQILDGKGLYVIMDDLPKETKFIDSVTQRTEFFLFPKALPQVFVQRIQDKWYYHSDIGPQIELLHKEVYPFGSDILVNLLPHLSDQKWFGIFFWQWLGLILLLASALVVYVFSSFIIKRLIILLGNSTFWLLQKNAKLLKRISYLVGGLISIRLLEYGSPSLLLGPKVSWIFLIGVKTVTALLILLIILKTIDVLYSYFYDASLKTHSKMDEQLLPVLRRGLQVILISLWLVYLLSLMNVDVTALLAGISIGGIALALAAQDTIKNLLGSFTIFMDKPFQIGDWIQFGSVEGTVEEVGFRSTRVRSFENSLMSVPNAKLLDTSVNNYGLRRYRRFKTNIAITYDTPPDKIEAFTVGLRSLVLNHPHTRKDVVEIHLNNMSASSLDILFYMFFDVGSWSDELKARHEIIMSILRLAKELDISFAFPSLSVYQEN